MAKDMKLEDWIGDRKAAKRSKLAKEARKGHDFGKKNGKNSGFKAVAKKAAKEYGSKKAGERVAAAEFWKMHNAKK